MRALIVRKRKNKIDFSMKDTHFKAVPQYTRLKIKKMSGIQTLPVTSIQRYAGSLFFIHPLLEIDTGDIGFTFIRVRSSVL